MFRSGTGGVVHAYFINYSILQNSQTLFCSQLPIILRTATARQDLNWLGQQGSSGGSVLHLAKQVPEIFFIDSWRNTFDVNFVDARLLIQKSSLLRLGHACLQDIDGARALGCFCSGYV